MDLYALLGVDRSAGPDDIERAYRRLARQYHPGVNPGDPVAAGRYQQIESAYDVLGDPDRRRDYDRGVSTHPVTEIEATVSFHGFDFSAAAEGPQAATFSELFADVFQEAARRATNPERGAELVATLRIGFEDAVRGGQFPMSIVRQDRCPTCGGSGRVARPAVPCGECGGQGTTRWARGHMVFSRDCEACAGSGLITSDRCRTCAGEGVSPRSEVVTLTLPPGVEDGARLAVPGRGHAGAQGGPPGDLYVVVEVADHPFFRRDGRDLYLTLPVAVHEAALGARVDVPTVDGPVRLRIPPGTPSGHRFRLRERGVPSGPPADRRAAGDLIVEVQIVLPPVRDQRSRELLREFGQLNDGDVRRHLFERD
jgi:molecular chaperone DnaJ